MELPSGQQFHILQEEVTVFEIPQQRQVETDGCPQHGPAPGLGQPLCEQVVDQYLGQQQREIADTPIAVESRGGDDQKRDCMPAAQKAAAEVKQQEHGREKSNQENRVREKQTLRPIVPPKTMPKREHRTNFRPSRRARLPKSEAGWSGLVTSTQRPTAQRSHQTRD